LKSFLNWLFFISFVFIFGNIKPAEAGQQKERAAKIPQSIK